MKKISTFIFFGVALWLTACNKDHAKPEFRNAILGNWMAVSDDNIPTAVEWSFFYEGAIKFYPDNSFAVNVPAGTPDNGAFKIGTWILKDNNSSIIFYSVFNDAGIVERDTTEFKISIDSTGKLVLRNAQSSIRHKRIE